MNKRQRSQLLVLKPTAVFYAFLISQLKDKALPHFSELHINQTCWIMPYFDDDEKTIDHIEANFSYLFQHEIRRWLGKEASNPIIYDWDNFVLSFDFLFHTCLYTSHPINVQNDLCAIIVHPKRTLLKSLPLINQSTQVNGLCENGTVMITTYTSLDDIMHFCHNQYPLFVNLEQQRIALPVSTLITSYEQFIHYYRFTVHLSILNRSIFLEGLL